MPNIWATFVRKFVANNFLKKHDLVTLLVSFYRIAHLLVHGQSLWTFAKTGQPHI